jgi:hypothetical protein
VFVAFYKSRTQISGNIYNLWWFGRNPSVIFYGIKQAFPTIYVHAFINPHEYNIVNRIYMRF